MGSNYQVEITTWFAHAGQSRLLGEDVTKHTDDHRQQKDKVATGSNTSENDKR